MLSSSRPPALRRRLISTASLSTLALLLPGLPAAAQTAQTMLDPVVLSGTGAATGPVGGPVGGLANPPTLAGTKTATPLVEIPQSVSVIGQESFNVLQPTKVDEVLGYTAGVTPAPFGHDTDTNWINIRGFEATQTGMFLDGLAQYSYGFGGFYTDPFQLERVEVFKGPASVLYGGANPGGMVNMVSKRPTGVAGGEAQLGLGTDSRLWGTIDVNGATPSAAWRFLGKLERQKANGAFDDGFTGLLAPSVSFELGEATDVTIWSSYLRVDETHVGGSWLPYVGTVERADFGFIPRDFNSSDPKQDWYKRDQFTLGTEIRHDFDNGWVLTQGVRLAWSDIDESAPYAYGYGYGDTWNATFSNHFAFLPQDPGANLSRIFFQQQTTSRSALADTRLERTATFGGAEHRLAFGLDLRLFEMDQVQASVSSPAAPTISVLDPVYGVAFPPAVPYIDQSITMKQAGLYAQDQILWGDLLVTLNGRYDWVKTDAGTNEATGAEGVDRSDGQFTGRIGLGYEFDNGLVPYASYATYFTPQIVNDAGGNTVEPETGGQAEIGVKWSPDERVLVTLSAFDLRRENVSISQWNGTGYSYFQVGKIRSRGVELEAKAEVVPGLQLTGAVTAMDVEVRDDLNPALIGTTPKATPEDFASLRVDWAVPQVAGLTLMAGARHIGSSWADDLNTYKVPSVTLYDIGASYDFGTGWRLAASVTNLTDKTYVASCDGALSCFYGDGRRAALSLTKSW